MSHPQWEEGESAVGLVQRTPHHEPQPLVQPSAGMTARRLWNAARHDGLLSNVSGVDQLAADLDVLGPAGPNPTAPCGAAAPPSRVHIYSPVQHHPDILGGRARFHDGVLSCVATYAPYRPSSSSFDLVIAYPPHIRPLSP